MARLNGLGLGPGDSCVDPRHPWWLLDSLHTAYECNCMVAQGRPVEELCVSAAPGGTPASYTRPANVPSYGQIITETPGYVIGSAANVAGDVAKDAGKGFFGSLNLTGALLIGGLGFLAFTYLTKRY